MTELPYKVDSYQVPVGNGGMTRTRYTCVYQGLVTGGDTSEEAINMMDLLLRKAAPKDREIYGD